MHIKAIFLNPRQINGFVLGAAERICSGSGIEELEVLERRNGETRAQERAYALTGLGCLL